MVITNKSLSDEEPELVSPDKVDVVEQASKVFSGMAAALEAVSLGLTMGAANDPVLLLQALGIIQKVADALKVIAGE